MRYLLLCFLLVGCTKATYTVDCEGGYKGEAYLAFVNNSGTTVITMDGRRIEYSQDVKCEVTTKYVSRF